MGLTVGGGRGDEEGGELEEEGAEAEVHHHVAQRAALFVAIEGCVRGWGTVCKGPKDPRAADIDVGTCVLVCMHVCVP